MKKRDDLRIVSWDFLYLQCQKEVLKEEELVEYVRKSGYCIKKNVKRV